MIELKATNIKKFYNVLFKYLEQYAFVKLWHEKKTYHAKLCWYYDKGTINIAHGNKHFKLRTILYKLGCKEGNYTAELGRLLRSKHETRCQNGRYLEQRLF